MFNFYKIFLKKWNFKTQAELLAEICNSTDRALELAQQSWFNEGLQRIQHFVKLLKNQLTRPFYT